MNEEIDVEDIQDNDEILRSLPENSAREVAACQMTAGENCDPEALNPRNYAFVPSCWTNRIRPAGRNTQKSTAISEVFKAC
jgi:hypothetical protein